MREYPWPTKEQFKQAFLELDIPDDDLAIARKNLDKEKLRQKGENMRMSASMNYRNVMDRRHSKLYYAGQMQPISILNPFAWAKFIKAWRDGKFKKKIKSGIYEITIKAEGYKDLLMTKSFTVKIWRLKSDT